MVAKITQYAWTRKKHPEIDFGELYQTELPRVYNFFRYRISDGQLAEDLTAETFEKAWRYRGHYRQDRAAFSTWLFTIARRVATDYFRKHRQELSLDELPDLAAPEITEDLVQQQSDFSQLSVLLARLNDRDRELVALKYGAGITNRRIADLTGLSESNVGVILHRAVESLRKTWEEPR